MDSEKKDESDWHVEIDGVMVPISELEDSNITAGYFKDSHSGKLTGKSYPIIILPDKDPHGYIDGFFLLGKVVVGLLLIGVGVFFIMWFGGL